MAWVKPYGYLLGVAYMTLLVWDWWQNRASSETWHYNLPKIPNIGVLWTAVVMPLPLQHWIIWKNPVYPVLNSLFGGLLIDSWSRTHNLMLLDVFSWDGYNILSQLLSEPAVAFGSVAILIPAVRRDKLTRILWLVPCLYALLYRLILGSTISNAIPGAHARYQEF